MTAPPHLTDEDYQRLLTFRCDLRRFLAWSEEQARAAQLTVAQHQLLLAIRGSATTGGPNISEISDALLLEHHSTVGLVARAERAGLVRRHPDERDRRVVRLQLTRRGSRVLEGLAASHLAELDQLAWFAAWSRSNAVQASADKGSAK